jgi:hypothetical protein
MIDIDSAIQKLSACRDDLHCQHEKECFALLEFARSILGSRVEKAEPIEDDTDSVADYAPRWGLQ